MINGLNGIDEWMSKEMNIWVMEWMNGWVME